MVANFGCRRQRDQGGNPLTPRFLRAALALGLLLPLSLLPGQTESVAPTPSDAEIRQILIDRIDRDHQGVGIAVGVIDAKGRRVIAYGSLAKDDRRRINGDTVFEIGPRSQTSRSRSRPPAANPARWDWWFISWAGTLRPRASRTSRRSRSSPVEARAGSGNMNPALRRFGD
jgi:hypothetical protein